MATTTYKDNGIIRWNFTDGEIEAVSLAVLLLFKETENNLQQDPENERAAELHKNLKSVLDQLTPTTGMQILLRRLMKGADENERNERSDD